MAALLCLATIVGLLYILYKRWARVYDHWKEKGIPYTDPYPLVGNMLDNVLKRKRIGQVLRDIAVEHNKKSLVGMFNFMTPVLLINKIDYANTVMIKEFSHFMDRGPEVKDSRAIDKHLFSLTGVEWKAVRTKFSPVFTTGKLKGMLPLIEKCFENAAKRIDSSSVKLFNLKDIIDVYTINVRGSCLYGLESDMDPKFTKAVDEMSTLNFAKFVRLTITVFFPKLAVKLNLSSFGNEVESYTTNLLLDTIKKRAEMGVHKNDYIQTLLQLKQTGQVEISQWSTEDDYLKMDDNRPSTKIVEITDDILVAQSMIFLLAGLDILKTSLILTLIELAKDRRALEKLRDEVDKTIGKYKEFSYQAIKEMDYLEMCVKEILRLHPPAEFGTRYCVREFTFPDGTKVEKDTHIFIPINKFHWDPEHFPEPMKFLPERFAGESDPPAYMPFGQGPRLCIAMRFAMLEMKMFLAKLVYNYDMILDSKTKLPVKFDTWFFLLKTVSPVYMHLSKRKHDAL